MQKNFKSPYVFIKRLLKTLDKEGAVLRYGSYQNLLYSCLPQVWHQRVLLGKIEGKRWYLWVENGSDAYQLRFLLSEIQTALGQKLPVMPELRVTPRPDIWMQQNNHVIKGTLYRRHYYTPQEAERVIADFMDTICNKK